MLLSLFSSCRHKKNSLMVSFSKQHCQLNWLNMIFSYFKIYVLLTTLKHGKLEIFENRFTHKQQLCCQCEWPL